MDSLTLSFRSTLGEELFQNVAICRNDFPNLCARGLQNGFDLFAAALGFYGLLLCRIESCRQDEAAERTVLPGGRLRQSAMLLRCGTNAEWLADCS